MKTKPGGRQFLQKSVALRALFSFVNGTRRLKPPAGYLSPSGLSVETPGCQWSRRFLNPGSVVITPSCGSRFKAIAHAVAIDYFYDTNAELITQTYRTAIEKLAEHKCRNLIAACLGCGYGRCTTEEFLKSILELAEKKIDTVDTLTFATTNKDLAASIASCLGQTRR